MTLLVESSSVASMDPSQWPSLSKIDPEFQKFLETANLPHAPPMDDPAAIPAMRVGIEQMHRALPCFANLDRTGVVQDFVQIPVRDGSSIPAAVFRPESVAAGPLAVLYHAGAFVIGYPEMQAPVACHLVQTYGAVVLSIGYRKAPEHPFPAAIHDSWDALKWCAANAEDKFGADPGKGFLIGGDSMGGGNITAVISHLARDESLSPPLTGVWLAYPSTVAHDAVPENLKSYYTAYEQNLDAPGMLKKDSLDFFRRCYGPDPKSDLFNVLGHSKGHAGLPKTYVQVCGLDPLRDDGLLYERELRQQGTETKLDVYAGVPHTFDVVFRHLGQAKKFDQDREAGFAWLMNTA